jgi:hypothetical protein
MDAKGLLEFLRQHRLAVEASVSASGAAQAAVVGTRLSWPGLIYVRIRPTWIRYSNYNIDPPQIVEFTGGQLVI